MTLTRSYNVLPHLRIIQHTNIINPRIVKILILVCCAGVILLRIFSDEKNNTTVEVDTSKDDHHAVLQALTSTASPKILRPPRYKYDIHQHYNQSDWGYCDGYVNNEKCTQSTSQLQAPTAVNIGVMKSGTTALDWALDLHSDIVILNRESFFFGYTSDIEEGMQRFCNKLPCLKKPAGIILDRCPFYFFNTKSSVDIYNKNKNMKLLLIVREPVERMMSHLVHTHGVGVPWNNISSKVLKRDAYPPKVITKSPYIEYSSYYKYLHLWLDKFEVNKTLFVIDHHRFRHDLYNVLYKIEEYLELPHKISPNDIVFNKNRKLYCKTKDRDTGKERCMGWTKGRNHTEIPPEDYFHLKIHFRKFNDLFFKAIGEDFGWNDYFQSNSSLHNGVTNV